MKSLAMLSQKGGVGKTTIALHLALAFARSGRRTLLIDYDPQGAIALSLGEKALDAPGLAAMFHERRRLESVVLSPREKNLSLLPGGHVAARDLDDWEAALVEGGPLTRALAEAEPTYDLVIVDTAAGLVGTASTAARLSRRVLVPLQCEPLALRTIPHILDRVGALRSRGDAVELLGIVLNMSNLRDDTSLAVLEEAWALYPELVLSTHVPRDATFLKASAAGVPVAFLGKRPAPVNSAFDQLQAELALRLFPSEESNDDTPQAFLD